MKPSQIVKNVAQSAFEPWETLNSQITRPIIEETARELGFGGSKTSGAKRTIAQEELQRAREKRKLEEEDSQDKGQSSEKASALISQIQSEYQIFEARTNNQQGPKKEFVELQEEIAKLSKTAGVETKAHLETIPKKVGVLDIKRLTSIVRYSRIKVEESKSAKELVSQRANAKRTTGMLAWVSGKQMKVHEQGTLQLQG